jgi:hypothetical protein
MSNSLIFILVGVSVFVIFSPIYFQRRKLWRMADEDLKQIDSDEWKKQLKSNAYGKLISRIIWGLFLLSGFVFNFQKVVAAGFNLPAVFVLVLGVSFIIWGILGFRSEIRKLSEIK